MLRARYGNLRRRRSLDKSLTQCEELQRQPLDSFEKHTLCKNSGLSIEEKGTADVETNSSSGSSSSGEDN